MDGEVLMTMSLDGFIVGAGGGRGLRVPGAERGLQEAIRRTASVLAGVAHLRGSCYRIGHAGSTLVARSGPGEPRVGAWRGGDGALQDVRARARGWRRGDRRARPARRLGTGRDAYGLH